MLLLFHLYQLSVDSDKSKWLPNDHIDMDGIYGLQPSAEACS